MYVKEDQLEENFSFAAGIKLLKDFPWLPSLFLLSTQRTRMGGRERGRGRGRGRNASKSDSGK